ncbi:hypothetical protein [Rhizobium sp. 18055]|uniref:hypothetical protein n=1 Tax=Rhizobium sp. 18055 TaxID=2681403 RepID=UPI001356986C|nr:hypothetical protein [Rhizobium sp. 18055]
MTNQLTFTAPIYREFAAETVLEGAQRFLEPIAEAVLGWVRGMSIGEAEWISWNRGKHHHDFGRGAVRSHPGEIDAHDLLTAFHDRLDRISDETHCEEIRRIFAQIVGVKKVCDGDIVTLCDLLELYIPIFADEIAPEHGISAWEAEAIIQQRLDSGDLLASKRMQGLYDPSFDLGDYTRIDVRDGVILVKCSDLDLDAEFGSFQASLRETGVMNSIVHDGGLFDLISMAPRTVNGVLTSHDALRFVRLPSVASTLVRMAQGKKCIVDEEVRLLALKTDHDFEPTPNLSMQTLPQLSQGPSA